MDSYFPIILTQNVLLILGTSCFIHQSSILNRKEKTGFYLCLYTGLIVALSELISTACAGKKEYILLQIASNYVNIGLTPLLPVIPVLIIGRSRTARMIGTAPVLINLGFLLTGQLFSVDAGGGYHREAFFWVFMSCYIFNMFYLTWRIFVFSGEHQNHNVVSLLFICLFMISSTTIQLRLPQIHFSWFCVTVTVLLYFIYYADTVQKMDSLTGLLNRNAFLDYWNRRKKKIEGILLIDLDDFKHINDTYGHLQGDGYLIAFSDCLRKVMHQRGYCYRLGGDEFCVLLDRNNVRPHLDVLIQLLRIQCDEVKGLPEKIEFSCGYQALSPDMTVDDLIELADRQMYDSKAIRKKERKTRES